MRCALFVAMCGALFLSGCGGGARMAKVSGRVTVGGKVVTSGMVTFHFPNGEGRPALGAIQPDGTYTLTTTKPGDGAPVGDYIVTIASSKVGPESYRPATPEEEAIFAQRTRKSDGPNMIKVPGKVEFVVPEIYSQPRTSPLRKTVQDKVNEINFDLDE
jgi:hypothetical protein